MFAAALVAAIAGGAPPLARTADAQGTLPGAAGTSDARTPAAAGVLAGTVRAPGGGPLVGAEVVVTPLRGDGAPVLASQTYTGDDGSFRLPGVADGRARLAVRRIGFRPQVQELTLPAAAPLTITLEALPQALSAVVVRDQRRSTHTGWASRFYERKDRGFGRFITREQILRQNAMRTTDLLRSTVPGVRFSSGPMPVPYFRNNSCPPFVWIDGAPASAGYLDIDSFDPQSLEGVEVYSGVASVPLELRGPRGEGACGVIALWTRMPEPRRKRKKTYTAAELAQLVAAATVYTADQVDTPAQADTAAPLAPVYPDSLRRAGTTGEAIVEFVVDTLGQPEPETVGVVAATHPAFGFAARDAVTVARYAPALREGQRVRQLVQVPVRFEAAAGKR